MTDGHLVGAMGLLCIAYGLWWALVHVRREGPDMRAAGRSELGDSLSLAYAILFCSFGFILAATGFIYAPT